MSMRRLAALATALFLTAAPLGGAARDTVAPQAAGPRNESTSSLTVTPISVPQGTIRVYLPADMAAGDTISGTVVAEPAGTTDAQRSANTAVLDGYVVDAGTKKINVAQRAFTFVLPALGSAAALVLREPKGNVVGRSAVPVRPQQPAFSRPPLPQDFHFPPVVAAGQPFAIDGRFTGDFAKSTLAVGGQPAEKIAESPRTLVAAPASNVSGPSSYQLNENGVAVAAPCNVASLSLSASSTRITKGARVTVHVAVGGLDGIRGPVHLRLVNATPDVIALAGGQTQQVTIAPGDLGADRTYATDRDVTGLRAGAFALFAVIDAQNAQLAQGVPAGAPVAQSQPPLQAPQEVHAARNPITSDWPKLSKADTDSVQAFLDAATASRTAAGVRKAREDALAQLVKVMKKYCCNFNTMRGGAPVYDPATEGEGTTERKAGGQVSIGNDAFTSIAWLYSSLKHEMVHSQQWQIPAAAGGMGSDGREKEAYQREVDQAGNTGLSPAEKAEDERRLGQYK